MIANDDRRRIAVVSSSTSTRPFTDTNDSTAATTGGEGFFTAPAPELIPPAGPKKRHDKP
jgi:hypothetical protein